MVRTTNPFLTDLFIESSDESDVYSMSSLQKSLEHSTAKDGKMFVGGLDRETTVDSMRAYFQCYGELEECMIMRDSKTQQSRGFGFVTFTNPANASKVLAVRPHYLDGKEIDPQIAIRHISPARSVNNICRKVFVGGVSQFCNVDDIKRYFSHFGEVEDAILKVDYGKKMQKHRGFGFITFYQHEVAELVCAIRFHTINGKPAECKRAQRKEYLQCAEAAEFEGIFPFADQLELLSKPQNPLMNAYTKTGLNEIPRLSFEASNTVSPLITQNMPHENFGPPRIGAPYLTPRSTRGVNATPDSFYSRLAHKYGYPQY